MSKVAQDTAASVQRNFLILGAALFLIGLVSGLVTGFMSSPRLGLSAHLEGVMNGTFLLAVGAAWPYINLSDRLHQLTFWSLAFGTTVNWLSVQLAAFWGAGRMAPITAPGLEAAPWQEWIVMIGLAAITIAMLLGSILLLIGFVRARR